MHKLPLLLLALLCATISRAQKTDAQLQLRLNTYMRLTRELKAEELMDYMHPNIFKLAPRAQLATATRQAFDNEQLHITIDSIHVNTISPDFVLGPAHYRRVDYGMWMRLYLKDTSVYGRPGAIPSMTASMERSFDGATVHFNEAGRYFDVFTASLLMAIKDSADKPWLFLGYQKNGDLLKKLYPEAVITHFKLL